MSLSPSPQIVRVAVPVPLWGLFDYLPLGDAPIPAPGSRVVVPFGGRKLVGLVVACTDDTEVPQEKLQPLLEVPDGGEPVVSEELLDLLRWCARYYRHPVGEVLCHALPPALRRSDGRLPEPPR